MRPEEIEILKDYQIKLPPDAPMQKYDGEIVTVLMNDASDGWHDPCGKGWAFVVQSITTFHAFGTCCCVLFPVEDPGELDEKNEKERQPKTVQA